MIDVEKAIWHLEDTHKENLESEIITLIAQKFSLDASEALSLYFKTRLSREIAKGSYGIQYLDAHYLLEDLLENEASLFDGLPR